MWPLNLPACDVLRLPGGTSISWAAFDADWYRATYPTTTNLTGASDREVLAFYFESGQQLGHSPNMLFDETWHLRTYPGIAALVKAGEFPSAFDAWCRGGCLERSPHWLFDELEYRRRNPDVTDAFLSRNGLVNGYDHYLWRGNLENRIGNNMFDPMLYRASLDSDAASDGPFWDCLRRLHRREQEVRTSVCFNPEWYLRRYPEVAEAIRQGTWRWALEHYLCNTTPTQFDPVPGFSDTWYLAQYDDAAGMVRRGGVRNGFAHFLRHGAAERRSLGQPGAGREPAEDAFVHWLKSRQSGGQQTPVSQIAVPPPPIPEPPVPEFDAGELSHRRARTLSVLHARTKLNFATTGVPALSVIMVLHDRFDLTMMALGSLRANYRGDIDLVLIDSGSSDETRDIERYVHGATHFRFDTNIGLPAGCNAALQFAVGDAVLYLSNAVELAPNAIPAALRRLHGDPRIGATGGMIVRSDGRLWQAGAIVWRDGTTDSYARDNSPLMPEANFARDVDFCSGVFLMARRSLMNQLEGFDTALAPGRYQDADLCLRMKQAGFRVIYDPGVVAHYLDHDDAIGGPDNDNEIDRAHIDRAHQAFTAKHADHLARSPVRDQAMEVFARMADTTRKRVLFIEDTVPLRMIGSGFVRSNDILRQMASLGYVVTVYPLNGCPFDVASVYADMPDGVEVMHDSALEQFERFLTIRRDYYDVIWVARTHNLSTVRAALELTGAVGHTPPVMLDTEAIASVRDATQAALEDRPFDLDEAVSSELRDGLFCDKIIAINEAEATVLRDLRFPDIAVIGHMRVPCATPRPFAQRTGMLFVGAIHRMDSPNYDSLCWFVDEVLPLIARELTWETRLTVAGYTGMGVNLDRFRDHPRVTLRGAVSDLRPLYDSHLVFVAPTRIAAGTPYKVHEAASFGLPVVATELLRQQLGWVDGRELLAASATDPALFARHAVAAQRDAALWQRLRDAAMERLRLDNNPDDYAATILSVLGPPLPGG